MKKFIKSNINSVCIFAAIVFVIFLVLGVRHPFARSIDCNAEKGVEDLTQWNKNDKNVVMNGEWEFYWERFVSFYELNKTSPDLYVLVSNSWNKYELNSKNFLPLCACQYSYYMMF